MQPFLRAKLGVGWPGQGVQFSGERSPGPHKALGSSPTPHTKERKKEGTKERKKNVGSWFKTPILFFSFFDSTGV
jgi:hypothetical protein